MVSYLNYTVQFHGLKLKSQEDIDNFTKLLRATLEKMLPNRSYDSDIEIKLYEQAGIIED